MGKSGESKRNGKNERKSIFRRKSTNDTPSKSKNKTPLIFLILFLISYVSYYYYKKEYNFFSSVFNKK